MEIITSYHGLINMIPIINSKKKLEIKEKELRVREYKLIEKQIKLLFQLTRLEGLFQRCETHIEKIHDEYILLFFKYVKN